MSSGKSREDATLIDVLVDGFEKNEIMHGFHWRNLPMPDEASARRQFVSLSDEARRWKGTPTRDQPDDARRIVAWDDLEIRQVGRGIMVLVRAPWFGWWHEASTWQGDPMGPIYDWLEEEHPTR